MGDAERTRNVRSAGRVLDFMASTKESLWHVAGMDAQGPAPTMLCGHRLRGVVHRRLAALNEAQSPLVCAACWVSLHSGQEPDEPTGRHALQTGSDPPAAEPDPRWPAAHF